MEQDRLDFSGAPSDSPQQAGASADVEKPALQPVGGDIEEKPKKKKKKKKKKKSQDEKASNPPDAPPSSHSAGAAVGSQSAPLLATPEEVKLDSSSWAQELKSLREAKSFIVYVPQGQSGRIYLSTLDYGVSGLYTDSFSTCNIIIGVDQSKSMCVLIHADIAAIQDIDQIRNELSSLGDDPKVWMYFRQKYDMQQWQECLKKLKQFKIQRIPVAPEQDGIFINYSNEKISVTMCGESKLPLPLIHHPQEHRLLSVRKIEQIIGIHAKQSQKSLTRKYLNIYDKRYWEAFHTEFFIDQSHHLTKKELALFENSDDILQISSKLNSIVENLKHKKILVCDDIKNMVTDVSFYLQNYLSDFNAKLILKRNLGNLLNVEHPANIYELEKDASPEDKKFCDKLFQLTQNHDDNIVQIHQEVITYRTPKPGKKLTKFVITLLQNYDGFYQAYERWMKYHVCLQFYKEKLVSVRHKFQTAERLYDEKKYESAANLYKEFLKECAPFCEKNDNDIRKGYFKCGMCFLNLNKPKDADFFINSSKALLNLVKTPSSHEKLQIEEAIKWLNNMLREPKVAPIQECSHP